jgi:outer membrane receptor for ferrienterochelin and colicins
MRRALEKRGMIVGLLRVRTRCIAPLLWTFVAAAAAASGQSKDIMDLSPEALKTVQVYSASMYVQSDRQAPSSVTVITAEQIRQFGYRTLADALRSVRGFDITYDRNYSYVGVRGFSRPGGYNDQVLLLINGHRLNDNVYDQAELGTEFPLDVDLIERIEIVRGPSSSLYGTSAFLAVINVITKKAQSAGGLELSTDAAGFGSYRGRATLGGTYHGIEGLFSGTIYDSTGAARLFFPAFDSPATNYGIAQDADRDSSRSFYASLHFPHFALEALGATRQKGIPTASFGQDFNDNRSQSIDSRGYVRLRYSRSIFQDAEFIATAYFDRAIYHGVYVYAPTSGQGLDALNEDASRGDVFGTNARINKTLGRKHKATAGMEFRDNLRQDQTNYNLNPFQAVLDDLRSSQEWGAFVQDEFTIRKSLILNAGLRHDQYQQFGGTTNPRVALIYSPLRRTTFKAIYGQAFRAPNNYELYYGDHVSVEPNPLLRPEKIRAAELVWEQDLGADFRLSASGFSNQFTDLINQQIDPKTGFIVYNNFENAHNRGFEIEFGGKIPSGIEGRLSYTLQKTVDSTGLWLPDSPAQMAKANIIFPMARRRLAFAFELQYTDSRKTVTGSQVGSYVVSNLSMTSREFASGFRFSGSVYNVFNSPYSDPVGAEIVGSMVRQNGRDFRIQLAHTFRLE